ncbi:MAG: glycosyltransferase [Rothia sp. (in: high G+C Gram-positive bacteria)]|nr:glycosyltransferase [Rothia sp. (in: high G+C Gram-positive bacteria)]
MTEDIAIAHDYLTQRGGAERVVLAMHRAFPDATIYTTLYNPEKTYSEFKNAKIVVSPLNKIKLFRENHRAALPLLPFASSLLKVPARKTLVSSTGWAHGFNFAGKSFIYCHSPARWVYLTDQYLGQHTGKLLSVILYIMRPFLFYWDQRAAQKAGPYAANSTAIQKRINLVYQGKSSEIIFPPFSIPDDSGLEKIHDLEDFMEDSNYFLVVSRLLPYKNVDIVIQAFEGLSHKLLVVGDGPMADELQVMAPYNVRFACNISDAELRYAYKHARALLAVSYEDFGLTPLEAGSFGKPTIALHAGGYLDTIRDKFNGIFIDKPEISAIREGLKRFDEQTWDSLAIQDYSAGFSEYWFASKLKEKMENL